MALEGAAPREIVTVNGLNVRKCEPGAPVDTSCAKVATLPVGQKVRYLGASAGAWVNIAVDDLGLDNVWAHADYLTCQGAGDPGPAPTVGSGPLTIDVRFDNADGRARLDAQQKDIPVTVTIAGTAYRGARMEVHGATSVGYPKTSYDLKFGKCIDGSKTQGCEKGKKPRLEAALYDGDGTKSVDKVVLNASWIDGTMMRNPLAYAIARDLGALAPRTGWATLAFDGQAHGYYQAIEPVNEDFFDRRDVAWGGSLYKATQHRSWDPSGDPFVSTDNGPAFEVKEGPGSREELSGFFRDVQGRGVGDAGGVLDLEDYRRFHMVQSFVFNKDTFTKNYYLYRTPNALWRMVFWDCDTTFGQDWQDGHRTNPDEDWYFGGQMGDFANRFVGDDTINYLGRFRHELASGVLSVGAMDQRIDALANAIRGPVAAEVGSRGKNFDEELAWLKEAMRRRHAKLTEKINGECSFRPCH